MPDVMAWLCLSTHKAQATPISVSQLDRQVENATLNSRNQYCTNTQGNESLSFTTDASNFSLVDFSKQRRNLLVQESLVI